MSTHGYSRRVTLLIETRMQKAADPYGAGGFLNIWW